jgi:small subunit ribosomal protein S1
MASNAAAKFAQDLPDSYQPAQSFADLFETAANSSIGEGSVVEGTVVEIRNGLAIIDVGLKSEGTISVEEFTRRGAELQPGDKVEVYIDRYENRSGEIVLSREKAMREAVWEELEKSCTNQIPVDGTIFSRVKGGFTVDLNGAIAFLPGSQVDIRPIKDASPLMNVAQPFMILKMDRRRGNIVVSRRAILEESRADARKELLDNIIEGTKLEGVVKNITDYGVFVDLGGIDGLLHVTDISWKRINHPSEVFKVGQTIEVMVTKFDQASKRVSLGMKQLESNPWGDVASRFKVGDTLTGKISNITDYGAFVDLGEGIEGLVHVSEMSWTKKNTHPSKIVNAGQDVNVMVLDIDREKHRISLGIKQTEANPWNEFTTTHEVNQIIEGEIRNITDFGLFVALTGDIDGLVHYSDISWSEAGEVAVKNYKKGDMVQARILAIDVEKERISLGIKQLEEGKNTASSAPAGAGGNSKKGEVVTCVVTETNNGGIEVRLDDNSTAFIKKADLSRDRQEQRPERFAVGDRVDAKVISVGKSGMNLSIKAMELDLHKQAIDEYGSAESGASLGDILGAAINEAQEKKTTKKK